VQGVTGSGGADRTGAGGAAEDGGGWHGTEGSRRRMICDELEEKKTVSRREPLRTEN